MIAHGDSHEDRLLRLAEGGEPREAFERSELSACPRCRELLEDIVSLEERLADAGRDASTTIRRASALRGVPGEHEVEAVLRPLLSRHAPASGRVRVWPWVAAVAALLLVAVAIGPFGGDRPSGRGVGPERLGGEARRAVSPVGGVPEYGSLRWEGSIPLGGWYDVRVLGPDGEVVLEARGLSEPSLESDESASTWPDRIRWEVSFVHPSGALIDSVTAEAWRTR